MNTSSFTSGIWRSRFGAARYLRGLGSAAGRGEAGTRKGSSADMGVTQGEMVVAKLLARKGPRGWYSQDWMSRADQSLSRLMPKRCWLALAMGIGEPRRLD